MEDHGIDWLVGSRSSGRRRRIARVTGVRRRGSRQERLVRFVEVEEHEAGLEEGDHELRSNMAHVPQAQDLSLAARESLELDEQHHFATDDAARQDRLGNQSLIQRSGPRLAWQLQHDWLT